MNSNYSRFRKEREKKERMKDRKTDRQTDGAGEMTQQVRALAALTEHPGSTSCIRMPVTLALGIQCPLLASVGTAHTFHINRQALRHTY